MEPIYQDMLRALEAMGGKAINAHLMRRLNISPEDYIKVKQAALADKVIKLGRARGGLVILVDVAHT
jgi:hypothetical protein